MESTGKSNEEIRMAKKDTDNVKGQQMSSEQKKSNDLIKTSIYVPRSLWAALKKLTIEAAMESGSVSLNTVMVRALEEFAAGAGEKGIDSHVGRNYDPELGSLARKYEHWVSILIQILQGNNEHAITATKTILRVCLRLTELEGEQQKHEDLTDETKAQLAGTRTTLKRSAEALEHHVPVRRTRRKMA
jgi:hypothetical protein